jgi:DNA polymerase-4
VRRAVFHVRLKDFELQAERIMDSALRTRPVAILSSQQQDGSIIALSEEAREEGLFRGMKLSLARRMSHSVLLLPYNQSLYNRLNRYIYSTVAGFTPVVEPARFGQFYLDMSGMRPVYPDFKQAGSTLSQTISDRTSLTGLVGISANKLVSRISTSVIPERIHEIISGEEPHFLAPLRSTILPSAQLPAVKKLIDFLFLEQVRNIQHIAADPLEVRTLFGDNHRRVAREAQGQDTAVVRPPGLKEHLMEQIILPQDTNDEGILRGVVKTLAEQIAFQLRRRRQVARRIKLEIHYTDGLKNDRIGTITANTDSAVNQTCQRLFEQANYRRNRIRAVLLDATQLVAWAQQTNLFQTPEKKSSALTRALDQIRKKHGFNSIHAAATLGVTGSA